MDPLMRYDKKEDVTFFLCPLCEKENQIKGTHEYGFYMKCSCGFYRENSFQKTDIITKIANQEIEDINRTVESMQKYLNRK